MKITQLTFEASTKKGTAYSVWMQKQDDIDSTVEVEISFVGIPKITCSLPCHEYTAAIQFVINLIDGDL